MAITFTHPKNKLFERDNHFKVETLAHALFPENGDIHSYMSI
jgi:hypothetical protein